MNQTVIGVFTNQSDAQGALDELEHSGLARQDMSVVMRNEEGYVASSHSSPAADSALSGAVVGGIIGGLAGLFFGLGSLRIAGITPTLLSEPLAGLLKVAPAAITTLMGVGLGLLGGGIIGGLLGLGASPKQQGNYADFLQEKDMLLAVPTYDEDLDRVISILSENNAETIRTVEEPYQQELPSQNHQMPFGNVAYVPVGTKGGKTRSATKKRIKTKHPKRSKK